MKPVPNNVLLPRAYWQWAGKEPPTGLFAPEERIVNLAPNEVFVFGSNASGFHGAGSAGFAYTGKAGNQYREANPLLQKPNGHRGYWAVLGQARGIQEGVQGKSYAICTIERPGKRRSISLEQIRCQVEAFFAFAEAHPELTFLVTKSGQPGKPSLNGYTLEENASCYLAN
jgi:hypothetical protein